jgi:predicted Zn-dependent peptidase
MVVRDVLGNGLRLTTEAMPHVRSVTIGVWLMRGSRHESAERSGIAHFVEHMLFKGTDQRSAEDLAQAIDSIGGQMDAFTAKEYAGYYIKVLDEHLPVAVELLADIVLRPAFVPDEIEREKKVILEEIKMVEDTPDDLVHELFIQHFWEGHPLGRPILGSRETVESFGAGSLHDYFRDAYPQAHPDRYVTYILNTVLGGSMSSRLFQNVREKRGLAYSVFSGLSAYRDAGNLTIYAGCASEAVPEVIDLCVEELRGLKARSVPDAELRRAKDHLKGSLMLSLENTASRMSHLARQEIYFNRFFGLDETLEGVERVTSDDVQRVASALFSNGSLSVTVLGPGAPELSRERLDLG